MKIIIPGNTIAKKNSQRVVRMGKRYAIRASKAYDKWEKSALQHLQHTYPGTVWEGGYPLLFHIFFWRANKRKFDLSNMLEGSQDVLQKAGIIEDDSMRHVVPVFDGWGVDRGNPRVEIFLESCATADPQHTERTLHNE